MKATVISIALALAVVAMIQEANAVRASLRSTEEFGKPTGYRKYIKAAKSAMGSDKGSAMVCDEEVSSEELFQYLQRSQGFSVDGADAQALYEEAYKGDFEKMCRSVCTRTCRRWMENKMHNLVNDGAEATEEFRKACTSADDFAVIYQSKIDTGVRDKALYGQNSFCKDLGDKDKAKDITACFKAIQQECRAEGLDAASTQGDETPVDSTSNSPSDDTPGDKAKMAKGLELPHSKCAQACVDHFKAKSSGVINTMCQFLPDREEFYENALRGEYPMFTGVDDCPIQESAKNDLMFCHEQLCGI